jgi:hypothetical protein
MSVHEVKSYTPLLKWPFAPGQAPSPEPKPAWERERALSETELDEATRFHKKCQMDSWSCRRKKVSLLLTYHDERCAIIVSAPEGLLIVNV